MAPARTREPVRRLLDPGGDEEVTCRITAAEASAVSRSAGVRGLTAGRVHTPLTLGRMSPPGPGPRLKAINPVALDPPGRLVRSVLSSTQVARRVGRPSRRSGVGPRHSARAHSSGRTGPPPPCPPGANRALPLGTAIAKVKSAQTLASSEGRRLRAGGGRSRRRRAGRRAGHDRGRRDRGVGQHVEKPLSRRVFRHGKAPPAVTARVIIVGALRENSPSASMGVALDAGQLSTLPVPPAAPPGMPRKLASQHRLAGPVDSVERDDGLPPVGRRRPGRRAAGPQRAPATPPEDERVEHSREPAPRHTKETRRR